MKQAIIFASFGVIDKTVRERTIDAAVAEIQEEFNNYEVRQAFTSNFIRNKLKAQGVNILSIEEQIKLLQDEGFDRIIILPSHLTPGEEFDNKIKPFESEKVIVLNPIFTAKCDTEFDRCAFNTILQCFVTESDEELILIGHGSPHRHNSVYENLQKLADAQNLKVHIGVIEESDTPNFYDVINRLRNSEATKFLLAPLLFNGGSHIKHDIAGEDKNSWKSRLVSLGYKIRVCNDGLGTFKSFRELYKILLKFH